MAEGFLDILGVTFPESAHLGEVVDFTVHTENIGADDDFLVEFVKDVDLSNFQYEKTFSTIEESPTGIFFKPDGTKMYEIGYDQKIYQYSCSIPWEIGSCSYDGISVNTQDNSPTGIYFSPEGYKFYEVGAGSGMIYHYTCATPWDLSSCSCCEDSCPTTGEGIIMDIFISVDGTKLYELDYSNNQIHQSSIRFWGHLDEKTYETSISTQDFIPSGLFFKPDGTKMYEVGRGDDKIYQYSLSTAWDLSTASYDGVSIPTQDDDALGIYIDKNKLYELGSGKIYQYTSPPDSLEFSLGAGLTADITFSFTMPDFNVSAAINAYHYQAGTWIWDTTSVIGADMVW